MLHLVLLAQGVLGVAAAQVPGLPEPALIAQVAPDASRAKPAVEAGGRVERPNIKVGDVWRYRVTDKLTSLTQTVSMEVTSVTADRIHTQSTRHAAEIWDRDWNLFSQGETAYNPFYPGLQFPLERGKQWSGKVLWRASSGMLHHQVNSQVTGWERVTVPAGTFDAVKIQVRGTFVESQSLAYYPQQGNIDNVLWYAPAVGQIVKRELTHRDFTVAANGQVYERWELIEYKSN